MKFSLNDFDGFGKVSEDDVQRDFMKRFLRSLGLIPDPTLSFEDIDALSKSVIDNFGAPDRMLVDQKTFEALKKLDKGNK